MATTFIYNRLALWLHFLLRILKRTFRFSYVIKIAATVRAYYACVVFRDCHAEDKQSELLSKFSGDNPELNLKILDYL